MAARRRGPLGAALLTLALALLATAAATSTTPAAVARAPAPSAPSLSTPRPVRVLAVPLVAARSHLFVMWAVVEELAVRGNEVAVS